MAKDFHKIGTIVTPINRPHPRPGPFVVIDASESKATWGGADKYNWIKALDDGHCYWTNEDADKFVEVSHPLELLIYGL